MYDEVPLCKKILVGIILIVASILALIQIIGIVKYLISL